MGFIPNVDTGQLQGQIETIQGLGFDATAARVKDVMQVLQNDPNVLAYTANVGGGPGGGGGGARLNIELKPREQRTLTADQVIEELRPKLARIPGIRVFLSNPPAIRIGGMMTPQPVPVHAAGPGHRRSSTAWRRCSRRRCGTSTSIQDVTSDLQLRNPQLDVQLDRDQIAALGLTVDQVELALTSAYGTRQVSQIYAPDDQYQVILQVAPQFQRDPAALSLLYVHGARATSSCRCPRW